MRYLIICLVSTLWCGSAWAASPPLSDGEIRVVLNSDIRSTNIGVNRDGNTDTVMHHIVEGLVALREDFTVGPDLAKTVDVSPNGLTYHFTLYPDILFHNGEPLTSAEVKWSFERILDPKQRHRCASLFNGSTPLSASITDITTPDAYTVNITLEKPVPLFLTLLANVQCTAGIIHPNSYDKEGNWQQPIGTGPYTLKKWQRGSYILLERFPDYKPRGIRKDGYAGAKFPIAKYIKFVVVGDAGVAVESVRAGEVDLLPIMPPALVSWSQNHSENVNHIPRPLLSWNVLLMQQDDPVVGNIKMRQAIAAAIDIDKVAAFATYGQAKGNFSAMSNETPGYSAIHETRPVYDLDIVKRRLTEAKYNGEPIVIQTNRRFPTMYDNAVVIHAMLIEAGINADIEVLDYATQLSNFFSGKFQLSAFGYSGRAHGALRYANFIGPRQSNARYQWDGEKPFSLVSDALNAQSEVDLKTAFSRLHQAMLEDLPLIGLYNDYGVAMATKDITGFKPWGMGRPRLWGVSVSRGDSATNTKVTP